MPIVVQNSSMRKMVRISWGETSSRVGLMVLLLENNLRGFLLLRKLYQGTLLAGVVSVSIIDLGPVGELYLIAGVLQLAGFVQSSGFFVPVVVG